ncbi:MAG: choice-of-anchor D domain-containing protein, partial [Nitrospira sp.]|nr:choice-of-anchor D domain-containing protein [Nitrospira sp.]
ALGAVPKRVEQLATITNIGAQPLSIYDIRVVEGSDQFAVGGLPQAISKNTPLVLQPNQSQTLGVLFDAAKLGLQKGVIQIYTNDPETPIQRLTVIGTGLPDGVGPFDQLGKPGHDFVAVQAHRGSEPAQRTVSDAEGTWAVTVTPNTLYRVVVFDPESGLTAEGLVNSDAQGRLTNDAFGHGFGASTEPDKNGNGMPDDIDFAMGTAAPKPATSIAPAPGASSGSSRLGGMVDHARTGQDSAAENEYCKYFVARVSHSDHRTSDVETASTGGSSVGPNPDWVELGAMVDIQDETERSVSDLDLGTVIVDGAGGALRSQTIFLYNYGSEALTITDVRVIEGNNRGVTFSPAFVPGLRVRSLEKIPITVTFDPTISGEQSFTLHVSTDTPREYFDLGITAVGQAPTGDLYLTIEKTNAGGLGLSASPVHVQTAATIKNTGAQPLEIYDIRLLSGTDQFAIGGLPQAISRTTPLILQPGAIQTLGFLFDAATLGLQKGEVQIYSNDPETPVTTFYVFGTGISDSGFKGTAKLGNDFVLLMEGDEPVQRLRSDAKGFYEFSVEPGKNFLVLVYDQETGLILLDTGVAKSDGKVMLRNFLSEIGPSEESDLDNNGMPDDIDRIMGAAAPKPATSIAPALGSSSLPTGASLLGWSEKHRGQPVSRTLRNVVVGSVHTTRFNPSLFGWLDVMRTDDVLSTRRR